MGCPSHRGQQALLSAPRDGAAHWQKVGLDGATVYALLLDSTNASSLCAGTERNGVFRSKEQQERHLQFAVRLFLRGVVPR